jgi:hypothetical protein
MTTPTDVDEPPSERNALLADIVKGTTLRSVRSEGERTDQAKPVSTEDEGGLAGALARALATREKALKGNDSDDEPGSDDDEWDDD